MDFVRSIGIAALLCLLIMPVQSFDLTGTWDCTDGGIYYITQLGNTIVWYSEDTPIDTKWSQIAYGTLKDDTIEVTVYDVPKGSGTDFIGKSYHSIKMFLNVASKDELTTQPSAAGVTRSGRALVSASGQYENTWTRVGSNPFSEGD